MSETGYEVPSTDELTQRALDGVSAEFPTLRVTEGSEADAEARARARLAADQHQRLAQLERNVTPATADERGLYQWSEAMGLPRKGASKVRGTQALEVRGTPAATLAVGQTLQHVPSGLEYQNTTGATIGAGGIARVDVESIDVGSQTRLLAGEPLRFTAPPAGIDQSAVLVKSLVDGGTDEESIGAWRERLTLVWVDKQVSGSYNGYLIGILGWPDVVRGFIYRRKPTAGSLGFVAFKEGSGTAKLQTLTERQDLAADLQDDMINDTVIALEPIPRIVHVDVVAVLLPAFSRSFLAQYVVDSWDASTATLTLTTPWADDVGVGDYLTIESADPDATGASGKPVIVAAITGALTAVLVSADGSQPVLDFAPANGDNVYPSSAQLFEAWTAIRFGAGDCASAVALEQLGPANPGRKYGDWQSDMRAGDIEQLARSVSAVDDATATLSTGNEIELAVEFPFPDDDQVEVLLPGQVVVR
jgi:uncharacterized phage protein gp47/JayE